MEHWSKSQQFISFSSYCITRKTNVNITTTKNCCITVTMEFYNIVDSVSETDSESEMDSESEISDSEFDALFESYDSRRLITFWLGGNSGRKGSRDSSRILKILG